MKNLSLLTALISSSFIFAAHADNFTLTSNDIANAKPMPKAQEFVGFGCDGSNISPHLKWSTPPKGTKSFALTAYDPDAPTGSGWWHWQVINIPASVQEMKEDAGNADNTNAPVGSLQISNDYGIAGFGGACPPKGHGPHRYQFKIHALSVEEIKLDANASGALTGYMINANTLASSTIEALYERK